MKQYSDGTGSEWYQGCEAKDHLTSLAEENGINPLHVHDAPEKTAKAVWHLLPDGEDRKWLEAEFGPFTDAK